MRKGQSCRLVESFESRYSISERESRTICLKFVVDKNVNPSISRIQMQTWWIVIRNYQYSRCFYQCTWYIIQQIEGGKMTQFFVQCILELWKSSSTQVYLCQNRILGDSSWDSTLKLVLVSTVQPTLETWTTNTSQRLRGIPNTYRFRNCHSISPETHNMHLQTNNIF